MSRRVMVLMGGWSAERAVSLASGKACVAALRDLGHTVTGFDLNRHIATLVQALTPPPDAVFNALHGPNGEDGKIQGLLDMMGIAYTHSGALASALAMNKAVARTIFAANGLRVAEGGVIDRADIPDRIPVPAPWVLKPVGEGSSLGVHIVRPGSNSLTAEAIAAMPPRMLWERFIPGRELTVSVMDDRPLAVTELRPVSGFYDYQAKYTDGLTVHECPARLPAAVRDRAMEMALTAHRLLGCRGVTRADFRHDTTADPGPDGLHILEINTQPGMTPLSLVPEQAACLGMDFPTLVAKILEAAQWD